MLVQQFNILGVYKNCKSRYWLQISFSLNTLSFWTSDVTNYPKVTQLMSLLIFHFQFSIFVLETLKFEWQCSQYFELNPDDNIGRCSPALSFHIPIFNVIHKISPDH